MTPVLFCIVGLFLSCQAFTFLEPAEKFTLKYTAIQPSIREDVSNVADALIHFALGANNITNMMLITQLSDVMYVQLHSLVEKLNTEAAVPHMVSKKTDGICCQCHTCTRRCTQCGRSCCCNGSGGCSCFTCISKFNITFEAIKTPYSSLDGFVSDWAAESKEQLRTTVKSFFKTKLASSNSQCCKCAKCASPCEQCLLPKLKCCCKGALCACITCPFGNLIMEADSVDFIESRRRNIDERLTLVDSLIDKIMLKLSYN